MPRDGAIIFDGLIGQARRAPDCGKCGRSNFHQVLAAQMPQLFQWELIMEMRECAKRLQDLLSRANESLTDYDRETLEAAIKLLQQQADIEED
jgi:hypothetical protein